MLIELHMIKNFPPTNLNRDESGSPKTCFFGGSQRGRISSQSLKHAWRRSSEFARLPLGIRTRYLPDLISDELAQNGVADEYLSIVQRKITGFGSKDGSEGEERTTSQIMFFSQDDIVAVAQIIRKAIDESGSLANFQKIPVKQWQDVLRKQVRPITLDMALFGRMITDDSFKDVEASLQVAHAISTHTVNQESDFFTAVDDLKLTYGQDSGSAMMGDTDFNACCYYFYASIDIDQLRSNIEGSNEVKRVFQQILPTLIESMAMTNPSGKQNSFAGHAFPALICVERKEKKVPVSYVNAFEVPVRSTNGYTIPSILALVKTINRFDQCFGLAIDQRLWFSPTDASVPDHADKVETLASLMESVGNWLNEV